MINKEWHLAHKMPKDPTIDQRISWHAEHSKNCSCRPMPDDISKTTKEKNK